jgi:hypothetical protein
MGRRAAKRELALKSKGVVPMHHTMTVAAPARTVTTRRPVVAVKSDVKTGHDIACVTRGHAAGCGGAMAYYTRTGDPWAPEGRGCAAPGHLRHKRMPLSSPPRLVTPAHL